MEAHPSPELLLLVLHVQGHHHADVKPRAITARLTSTRRTSYITKGANIYNTYRKNSRINTCWYSYTGICLFTVPVRYIHSNHGIRKKTPSLRKVTSRYEYQVYSYNTIRKCKYICSGLWLRPRDESACTVLYSVPICPEINVRSVYIVRILVHTNK